MGIWNYKKRALRKNGFDRVNTIRHSNYGDAGFAEIDGCQSAENLPVTGQTAVLFIADFCGIVGADI